LALAGRKADAVGSFVQLPKQLHLALPIVPGIYNLPK
jgi:hypothetical protein